MFKFLPVMMLAFFSVMFTACGDDDEPMALTTTSIAGDYVGTLNEVGFPADEAERAYVTITRKSSSSVGIKIQSEGWGLDMKEVIMAVSIEGNVAALESETSMSIRGQIIGNNLTVTFELAGGRVFTFTGAKD